MAAGTELWGPGQAGWLDRLQAEGDNVRLALQRMLAHQDLQSFARVAFALWPFWWIRGYHQEGLRWVDKAPEDGSVTSTSSHAELRCTAGSLLRAGGPNQEVAAHLDESIRLAHEAADQQTLSWALCHRGFAAVSAGQPDLAGRLLDRACATSRQDSGDPYAGALAAIGKAHT